MKSRQASAASTSTCAGAAASFAACAASPGRSSVLDGMHAQYEHSPPTSSRSTSATRRPPSASAPAQCSPGRAAADDDDVVVAHVGSSVPACSATMYAAYQSGQFASRLPGALLVLAVGGRRTPKRARQVRRGCECRLGGVDPAGQPGRDLLQQPAVAVRVAERGEGAVAGVIGRGAADATARAVGLELSARRPGVEHLADLDTAGGELVARSLDVGDDQVEALGRAGRGRRDVRAELDRAPRAGRRELDDPEAVIEGEVGVEPPPEPPVELLRAVDIRDGDDDHLELHVDVLDARTPARVAAADSGHAHSGLLRVA